MIEAASFTQDDHQNYQDHISAQRDQAGIEWPNEEELTKSVAQALFPTGQPVPAFQDNIGVATRIACERVDPVGCVIGDVLRDSIVHGQRANAAGEKWITTAHNATDYPGYAN